MTDTKPVFSEKQMRTIDYCIKRGREIEQDMKRIQDEQNGRLFDTDIQTDYKKQEDSLKKEAAELRAEYREALEAKKKYEYHKEEELRLKEKWGF